MKDLLRRVRGVVGIGAAWGVFWGALNAAPLLFGDPVTALTHFLLNGAVGAIAGGTFASILSFAERGRSLEELSLKRVALWGAIGGALLAPLQLLLAPTLGAGWPGVIGSLMAIGTVAVARYTSSAALSGGEASILAAAVDEERAALSDGLMSDLESTSRTGTKGERVASSR